MDEIKLNKWKERFEHEIKTVQIEYNSLFLSNKLEDVYTLKLDESHEWQLQLTNQVPKELHERLQQIFLSTKPEDSI